MTTETPKTFITSIRCDLVELAKIALFLEDNNYPITNRSRSKVASLAVHLIASQLSKYKVNGTEDAIGIFRRLGYGESVIASRRDFKPLLKQLSKEDIQTEATHGYSSSEIKDARERDDFGIFKLAKENKIKENQYRQEELDHATESVVVSDKETKDVSELRTAMGQFGDAPVAGAEADTSKSSERT